MEKTFTEIFEKNKWGSSQSVSGPSSTLERTINLRNQLPELFEKYFIRKVFDAPCGDMNWMKEIIKDVNITYIGGDIVKPLIERNKEEFSKNQKVSFVHIDLTQDKFPIADLMISRDFLFHLSYKDATKFLKNFVESKINFLLTTTHINNNKFQNKDIGTGGWRWMDLLSHPYNFSPNPLLRILDGGGDRYMCLWTRSQIEKAYKAFSLHTLDA